MTAGGGSTRTYYGSVSGGTAFTSVQPWSIEANDVLDFATDPAVISFALKTGTLYQDGFSFALPANASACFAVDAPAGTLVRVGAAQTPFHRAVPVDTLGGCGG